MATQGGTPRLIRLTGLIVNNTVLIPVTSTGFSGYVKNYRGETKQRGTNASPKEAFLRKGRRDAIGPYTAGPP